MAITQWAPGLINAEFTHQASVEAEVGDLLWYDSSTHALKPASSFSDAGTAAATQQAFVALFAGVSNSRQRSTDATARNARCIVDSIYSFPCASATFAVGDYVTPTYTGGVLSDQSLTKTTNPALAIGRVVHEYQSATTTVKVRITSKLLMGLLVTEEGESGAAVFTSIDAGDAALPITGQVGSSSVGGTVSVIGGAGNGAFAGGAVSVTGGASGAGATGNGGAASLVGGAAASTNGSGGAVLGTGGVATGTGTGGAVTLTAGASAGAGGTGGSVNLASGAATGGTEGAVNVQTVTTGKLGFYGAAAVTQPTAYTQTYSTADKTHANATAATLTDSSGGSANTTIAAVGNTMAGDVSSDINNNFADLAAQHNALLVDVDDLKQLVNSVIDDLQALGLVA